MEGRGVDGRGSVYPLPSPTVLNPKWRWWVLTRYEVWKIVYRSKSALLKGRRRPTVDNDGTEKPTQPSVGCERLNKLQTTNHKLQATRPTVISVEPTNIQTRDNRLQRTDTTQPGLNKLQTIDHRLQATGPTVGSERLKKA